MNPAKLEAKIFKGKETLKKSVITLNNGEVVHRIKGVIFDPSKFEVAGFLLEPKGVFVGPKVLPFPQTKSIGPDAITIENKEAICVPGEDELLSKLIGQKYFLDGKKVVTEGGEELGEVDDLVYNQSGKVTGLELRSGVLTDIYRGKPFLPTDQIVRIGEDIVFVANNTVDLLRHQSAGLQKGVSEARQSAEKVSSGVGRMAQVVRDRASEYAERLKGGEAKEYAQDFWSEARGKITHWRDRASDETEERRIKNALGRPVTKVILDEKDKVILDTGDLITHGSIDRARRAGMLEVLLASVYTEGPEFSTEEMKARRDEEE